MIDLNIKVCYYLHGRLGSDIFNFCLFFFFFLFSPCFEHSVCVYIVAMEILVGGAGGARICGWCICKCYCALLLCIVLLALNSSIASKYLQIDPYYLIETILKLYRNPRYTNPIPKIFTNSNNKKIQPQKERKEEPPPPGVPWGRKKPLSFPHSLFCSELACSPKAVLLYLPSALIFLFFFLFPYLSSPGKKKKEKCNKELFATLPGRNKQAKQANTYPKGENQKQSPKSSPHPKEKEEKKTNSKQT